MRSDFSIVCLSHAHREELHALERDIRKMYTWNVESVIHLGETELEGKQ